MDDYVRESFVELMQRGIEVDVWPTNDVRVLWLSENRECLFVGLNKQSIAKQEMALSRIRVLQNGDDEDVKRIEVATEDLSLKFNVDTMASRDILIRNLVKLVDHHKDTVDNIKRTLATPIIATGTDAAFHALGTKRGQQMMATFGMSCMLLACLFFELNPFFFSGNSFLLRRTEVIVGLFGCCIVITVLIIEVFHRASGKSGKTSPTSLDRGSSSRSPARPTVWPSKKGHRSVQPEYTHASAP